MAEASQSQRPPSSGTTLRRPSAVANSETRKDLSFRFPAEKQMAILEWVNNQITLLLAQTQTNPRISASSTFAVEGPLLALIPVPPLLSSNAQQSSSQGSNNNNGNGGGGPPSQANQGGQQGSEELEQMTIKVLVKLVLNLGSFQSAYRSRAALALASFATIMTDQPYLITNILNDLESLDTGYSAGVTDLFKALGAAFSIPVLAFISGLEVYQNSNDWRTKSIVIAAISQLLLKCKDRMNTSDMISVIWNLYFALGAVLEDSPTNPSRISIIKALHSLVELYSMDRDLSSSIVRELLSVSNKSATEQSTIKATVIAIFDSALKRASGNETAAKHALDQYYALLLELISSQVESAYDLLSWTVSTFFQKQGIRAGEEKTSPNEFSLALVNHFKASPALIRYGSALALLSIATLQPNFPSTNAHVWNFIVSGVLDSDYLTAGLYLQLLESIDFGLDGVAIKQLVALVRRESLKDLNYDDLHLSGQKFKDPAIEGGGNREKLLNLVVKHSTPLANIQLHKLANSLDFIAPKLKLKQLELIKTWGRKSTKIDIYLMKIIIPICASPDEELQTEAIKVVEALLPGFNNAAVNEVTFLWSYISKLLNLNMEIPVCLAAVKLMSSFPTLLLNANTRDELFTILFSLCFSPSWEVRAAVYNYIGQSGEIWRSAGLTNQAMGILFLCMGDGHPPNLVTLVEQMVHLSQNTLGTLSAPLNKLKNASKLSELQLVSVYDQLATAIATNKLDLRATIETFTAPIRADECWAFVMYGVAENQLVRPDEYDYTRNNIQNPIWISLLFTKFNVPPPPIGEGIRRDISPTNPVGKRRFICGYLQCLFPTLGSFNPLIRRAAAVAVFLCCFKGTNGQGDMVRGLLEYTVQQLLTAKYVTYQLSAFEIFKTIVRSKVPGVSESILHQYMDLCLEFLHGSHSPLLLVVLLEMMEVFCLVFPKGISSRVQEIFDVTRPLLADSNPNISSAAFRLYPLLFRCAVEPVSDQFQEMLKNEIELLTSLNSPRAMADPLLSHLTADQAIKIMELSILSLGQLLDVGSKAFASANFLVPFLADSNPRFRLAALNSITSLMNSMNDSESDALIWILLPMFGDPSEAVRLAWSRFRRRQPGNFHQLFAALIPHPEDTHVISLLTWEEFLTEHPILAVAPKAISDLTVPVDQLVPSAADQLPMEDDEFHLPIISEKLMNRYKELVALLTRAVPSNYQNMILYQLECFRENPDLLPFMNIVLSEFACHHESSFEETAQILLSQLGFDLEPSLVPGISASIAGIRNIMINSKPMLKAIEERLIELSFLSEGELMIMIYVFDLLINLGHPIKYDLISKFCGIVNTVRLGEERRVLAAYLAGSFAVTIGAEAAKPVLDAFQYFLETSPSAPTRAKLYKMAAKILPISGDKHPLFRSMSVQAKKYSLSKTPHHRMQSLSIFRIFAPLMSHEESILYIFRFLADSDQDVREAIRDAVIDDHLISKAFPAFKALTIEAPEREILLSTGKLSTKELVGIGLNQKDVADKDDTTPLPHDPFNVQYFNSDRRKIFSKLYKIDELKYVKYMEPVTIGILDAIEKKVQGTSNSAKDGDGDVHSLHMREIQPIIMLQTLIPFAPLVAESLVAELLVTVDNINNFGRKKEPEEEESDVEMNAQKIDILSNMLIAFGNSKPELTASWMDRLEKSLGESVQVAIRLRNALYFDLERSFYYQNQFADIPIISDEQIATLQQLRDLTQDSILDVIKSGKTEKVKLMENRNDQWNVKVDSAGDALKEITILSLQVLSAYGMYYILTKGISESEQCKAFKFLIGLLDEENRGFRLLLVETLVTMVDRCEKFKECEKFRETVKEVLVQLVGRLHTENHTLYRKKADIASLASQLAHHFDDSNLHISLLRALTNMWRDGDSECRQVSINMVQYLGQHGVKTVIESFKETSAIKKGSDGINLVHELVMLGNTDDYQDKDLLQNLLRWRFSAGLK